jgi:hypothetical protein
MRADYKTIVSGLDQLYFSRLIEDETIESRRETIETFLLSNGWTWAQLLTHIEKEDEHG